MHVGGGIGNITTILLIRDDHAHADARAIRQDHRRFHGEQCYCFLEEDKRRMLAIIRAAFGDMASFINAVRTLLDDAHLSQSIPF